MGEFVDVMHGGCLLNMADVERCVAGWITLLLLFERGRRWMAAHISSFASGWIVFAPAILYGGHELHRRTFI